VIQTLQWGPKTLHLKTVVAFCIEVPFLFTGNLMYRAATGYSKHGGQQVWIKKAKDAQTLQKHVAAAIYDMGLQNACADADAYVSETGFLAPKDYWLVNCGSSLRKKDLTNFWKPIEDALLMGVRKKWMYGLGIDDSKAIKQTQFKDFLDKGDEIIKIVFKIEAYALGEKE
jgi:hypothetical protein